MGRPSRLRRNPRRVLRSDRRKQAAPDRCAKLRRWHAPRHRRRGSDQNRNCSHCVTMETKRVYLNGKWVSSDKTITVVNPATTEPIARVATVMREQVRQALADAQAAFKSWRELPAKSRADYLLAIAAELTRRREDVARI